MAPHSLSIPRQAGSIRPAPGYACSPDRPARRASSRRRHALIQPSCRTRLFPNARPGFRSRSSRPNRFGRCTATDRSQPWQSLVEKRSAPARSTNRDPVSHSARRNCAPLHRPRRKPPPAAGGRGGSGPLSTTSTRHPAAPDAPPGPPILQSAHPVAARDQEVVETLPCEDLHHPLDHGRACHRHQRLGHAVGLRAHAAAASARQDDRLHDCARLCPETPTPALRRCLSALRRRIQAFRAVSCPLM